ncbi:NitT/TauT family transport system substrate-binding protein [Microbacterium paludicola]|uniref:NitT/TauT family transport system substrate-binding protein n=1 Tax=Microbacterium paludicola TaxID=300019 RepID=A0ABU1I1X8_9MICO|nr:ABC transporter substrate-binding protein [Microbacterium paludicola]MDR6167889.1 NitT/TauT family transport system substrate-binding protein [Microbacterium paludicola]
MKFTRTAAVTVTAALALTIAGCAGDDAGSADGTTTVEFGIPTNMGANNSPMAVAQAMGYFEDEGLKVDIVVTGDSTSIVQGIDSGSLDIGSTPPEPIWQAMTKGSQLQLVYNYIRKQTGSLAVLDDSPITSLGDFEGAVIGQSSLGTSNMLLSEGILASADLTPDVDYSHLAVGTGAAALQALTTGQVDALSLWDTEYAAFEAQGTPLRYFTTEEAASLFSTTYFTSSDYAADNAETIEAFGRAMAKATLFTATNPEAALRIMYEEYPDTLVAGNSIDDQLAIDLVALNRRLELLTADDPQDTASWGAYSESALAAWGTFALDSGIIDSEVDTVAAAPNTFVEAYNDFDADAVVAEAQNWSAE